VDGIKRAGDGSAEENTLKDDVKDEVKETIEAIENYNFKILQKNLKEGLDPNTVDEKGVPLLHIAIKKGEPEGVKILLQCGANPNLKSPEKQRVYINTKLNPYESSMVQLTGLSPIMTCICLGESHHNPFHILSGLGGVSNPERTATKMLNPMEKKLAMLSLLIAYKGDVNKGEDKYGLTPLHMAANIGNPSMVRKLIDNGADIHKKAFTKHKEESYFLRDFTPLMMAAGEGNQRESAKCIRMLIKAGAKAYTGREDAYVPTILYRVLSSKYPEFSADLMEKALKIEGIHLDRTQSKKVLDEFLRNASATNDLKIVDGYVDKLLHPKARNATIKNDATYYAHLHSWVGVLNYDPKDTAKAYVHAEGWEHILGIPEKIRHLMLAINKVTNSKVDTMEQFGEKKDQVLTKLKQEVLNMANSYYTLKHAIMLGEYKFPYINDDDKRKDVLCTMEATRWCHEINQLKPGEVFSIGCGNLDHAIYIDYVKQPNNNISKIVYNLGAGSAFHSVDPQGRLYPYVISEIPQERFKNFDKEILEDLTRIIKEVGQAHEDLSLTNKIYASPHNTPKKILADKDFEKLAGVFAMKPQISGNCTVKNLNSAMLHRLKNKKLYQFVKNFEKDQLQERLSFSKDLIQSKELERDIRNFELMMGQTHFGNPQKCELEIFNFLRKRTVNPKKIYTGKAGDRIVDVIQDLKNPHLMDHYYQGTRVLFRYMERVAREYNSEMLQDYLKKLKKAKEPVRSI
jgi:ankyrin repeat protein